MSLRGRDEHPSTESAATLGGGIQAVSRSGQILRLFAEHQHLRVAEAAALLGLQRSTVHRYMASLAAEGLLEREPSGDYRIGPALLRLGMSAVGAVRVVEVAGPYMQRLSVDTGETVVLSLWGGHGPVVARVQEDDTRLVHVVVRVGSALPLNAAQGQVFLAHLADQTLAARLLAGLARLQRDDLERQIATVREDGMAINSLVVEGIRTIAVPVFDRQRLIAATLAIVGTTAAIPDSTSSGLAQALRQTAAELSGELGCVPAEHAAPTPAPSSAAAGGSHRT